METNILQQEIVLYTGTSFSQRQIFTGNNKNDSKDLTESERLEKACWDGMLDEMLPEIVANKKLHIWQIWDTEFSLQVEFSKYPASQKGSSINTHYFLRTMNNN
jgi:hypothetical protein